MIPRRVQIPTHTDAWMSGDRYGTVTRVTRTRVHVRMDRSRRTFRFPVDVFDAYGVTL